jgi:SAM-dependent methyltransferase
MRFSFGKNWQGYSRVALTKDRIEQGRLALKDLLDDLSVEENSFLDIGFGQGLTAHLASQMGAKVTGIDIDTDNLDAAKSTRAKMAIENPIDLRIGSILDAEFVAQLQKTEWHIVHSWGVLHHTGDMSLAVKNATSLVAKGGYFVCAIYNRHWSSLPWLWIKWAYNVLPSLGQQMMIALFYPIIYLAKWLVTGKNPKDKLRGMDFFYDVVDWVGGYPYEYASIEEFKTLVEPLGFECIKEVPANVPTGCNEFVFQRIS